MCPEDGGRGARIVQPGRGGRNRTEPALQPGRGGSRGGSNWGARTERGGWRGAQGGAGRQRGGHGGGGMQAAGSYHYHVRDEYAAEEVATGEEYEEERGHEPEVDDEAIYQMSLRDYKPVSLTLLVDRQMLLMEIDTGSALSCINKQVYDSYFSHLALKPCNLTLSFYDGTKTKPQGYLEVKVNYKASRKFSICM